MTERIRLVQGDTRPAIIVSLQSTTGLALDCTSATVRLKFRAESDRTVTLTTITGTLLTGYQNSDGTIVTTAPYDVAGSGGRVKFTWPVGALDVPAGNYEGEVEVTFVDSSVQTIYDVLKFRVREDFT